MGQKVHYLKITMPSKDIQKKRTGFVENSTVIVQAISWIIWIHLADLSLVEVQQISLNLSIFGGGMMKPEKLNMNISIFKT